MRKPTRASDEHIVEHYQAQINTSYQQQTKAGRIGKAKRDDEVEKETRSNIAVGSGK